MKRKLFSLAAIAAIIALIAACSNPAGPGDPAAGGDTVTVTSVTVSPSGATVQVGTDYQFTAYVIGTGNPPQDVTWTVTGGGSGTSINASGLLTVAADEAAETLTVRAASTHTPARYGTVYVTVTLTAPVEPDDYDLPTGLTATVGQTLNEVSLAGFPGWEWVSPNTPVGPAGEQKHPARYIRPGYLTITRDLEVTVTAQVIFVTITFDANGADGGNPPPAQTVQSGQTVTIPDHNLTRTGFTFAGWNIQADGTGMPFTSHTIVTADITVFAHWEPVVGGMVTLTFHPNLPYNPDPINTGNLGLLPEPITVPAGTVVPLPSNNIWPNGIWVGWGRPPNWPFQTWSALGWSTLPGLPRTQGGSYGWPFVSPLPPGYMFIVTEDITLYIFWTDGGP